MHEVRAVLACDAAPRFIGGQHHEPVGTEGQMLLQQRQRGLPDAAATDHHDAAGELQRGLRARGTSRTGSAQCGHSQPNVPAVSKA